VAVAPSRAAGGRREAARSAAAAVIAVATSGEGRAALRIKAGPEEGFRGSLRAASIVRRRSGRDWPRRALCSDPRRPALRSSARCNATPRSNARCNETPRSNVLRSAPLERRARETGRPRVRMAQPLERSAPVRDRRARPRVSRASRIGARPPRTIDWRAAKRRARTGRTTGRIVRRTARTSGTTNSTTSTVCGSAAGGTCTSTTQTTSGPASP
jgi:hypothetical protein